MRFLPENEEEWTKLKSDSILILYDYPLDYEIVEHGVSYHDPSLPLSKITWQYCVVPIGHSIPDYIKNEIIYEVCILKEDSDKNFSLKKSFSVEKFWDLLEYESMVLTGNLPDNTNPKTKALLPSKWTPKGYIYYYDNSLGKNVPIVQASVHARWSTHIETCLTDENGYFQTSQFRYKVNYAIKWQRADFEIRDGGLVTQAWYNGPKQKGDWNPVITGGASRMHAIIHRAARDYYYNNPFGIQSPPLNRWYNNILSIKAINENSDQANGDAAPWRRWINLAEIRIFNPNNYAHQIYATTIHELAHTSHWDLASRFKYYTADLIVCESWARGVQYEFTRRIYPNYTVEYSRGDYTGIVQDLIDDFKTTNSYYYSTYSMGLLKSYQDQVKGYSLQQIEQALKEAKTFNQWRDNLKNKYNNDTENNLDAAFNYWAN